ncbi:hypothetical protein C8J56DRAFT_1035670 [Mycena floridula]|nr:hypothetical protein C8J56DRAFT_1035670 [Mycena floridula]
MTRLNEPSFPSWAQITGPWLISFCFADHRVLMVCNSTDALPIESLAEAELKRHLRVWIEVTEVWRDEGASDEKESDEEDSDEDEDTRPITKVHFAASIRRWQGGFVGWGMGSFLIPRFLSLVSRFSAPFILAFLLLCFRRSDGTLCLARRADYLELRRHPIRPSRHPRRCFMMRGIRLVPSGCAGIWARWMGWYRHIGDGRLADLRLLPTRGNCQGVLQSVVQGASTVGPRPARLDNGDRLKFAAESELNGRF